MKKLLLLLFMLFPIIAFSETWNCIDDPTSDEFNFQRIGDKFIWLEGSEITEQKYEIPIKKENENYIYSILESFRETYAYNTSLMFNKKSQTFRIVFISSFDKTNIKPDASFGNCDVFEGKKIPPKDGIKCKSNGYGGCK